MINKNNKNRKQLGINGRWKKTTTKTQRSYYSLCGRDHCVVRPCVHTGPRRHKMAAGMVWFGSRYICRQKPVLAGPVAARLIQHLLVHNTHPVNRSAIQFFLYFTVDNWYKINAFFVKLATGRRSRKIFVYFEFTSQRGVLTVVLLNWF